MKSWKPFWFETNSAWGLVDSPDAWVEMRRRWNMGAHGMPPKEIYNVLSFDRTKPRQDDLPNFGSRREHIGGKATLRDFFNMNGMDTGIGA